LLCTESYPTAESQIIIIAMNKEGPRNMHEKVNFLCGVRTKSLVLNTDR
jgi:hypothetical protein